MTSSVTAYSQIAKSIKQQLENSNDKVVISNYNLPEFDFSQMKERLGGVYKFFGSIEFKNLIVDGYFIIQHVEIYGDLVFENVNIEGPLILEDVTIYGNLLMKDVHLNDSICATGLKIKKLFEGDHPKTLTLSNIVFNSNNENKRASIYLFPGLEVEGTVTLENIRGVENIGLAGAKIIGSLKISNITETKILDLRSLQIRRELVDPSWKVGEHYSPLAQPVIEITDSKIRNINLWNERDTKGKIIEGYYESRMPTIKFENVTVGFFLISNRSILGNVKFKECSFDDIDFINIKIIGDLIFESCEIKLGGSPTCEYVDISEIDYNFDVECTKRMIFKDTTFKIPNIEYVFLQSARHTLERNGYEKEADYHFLKEKRVERRINKINSQCNLKRKIERIISDFMDKTVLKPRNALFQSIVAGLFSTVIPVFPMFILAFLLAFSIPWLREFLEWAIADLTCKYGTDWKRPIFIWAIVVIVLFPLGYQELLGYPFWEAVYYSALVAVTLGLGSLAYTSSSAIKTLVVAEAIFGTFMWAVFITVFARKFMRR